MAEKGTKIASQRTGDIIATRDAIQTTGDGDPRVIQLFDLATRPLTNHVTLRGLAAPITTPDGVDLDSLPAELLSHLITVGDQSSLILDIEHVAPDGEVYITPIIFDSADNPIAVRATKSSSMGTAKFRWGSDNYASPQLQWEVMGAEKLGIHITAINGTENGVVIKGGLI